MTSAQLERRRLLPRMSEPVDGGELMRAADATQLIEHPASADGLELPRIADQHQPPMLRHGQGNEVVEGAGTEHPGFIDDERRPGCEAVLRSRRPVCVPLV